MTKRFEDLTKQTVAELDSSAAEEALAASCYWPKWDGPWWKMRLLHELGLTSAIPARALDALTRSLNKMPFHIFPITPEEGEGIKNPFNDTGCHCQVGTMVSVLTAAQRHVRTEVPWMRRWLASYQMLDGGYNCDEGAYLVHNECPSSMVATIAIFEALLAVGPEQWTEAERGAAERMARFLVARRLTEGSATTYNAIEQEEAKAWPLLCFPRFYHYDILRGLSALVRYAELTGFEIPLQSVAPVFEQIERKADPATGALRVERQCFAEHRTVRRDAEGEWTGRGPAEEFPLLLAVSVIGGVCDPLTQEWRRTREAWTRLVGRQQCL